MYVALRYYLDFEFMEDGTVIIPLSLGIVCSDGREFYVEFEADLTLANEWVQMNVLPHLLGRPLPKEVIRRMVEDFIEEGAPPFGTYDIEFWGYYADYDWVAFCQIFGRMVDLPREYPKHCKDIKQRADDLGNIKLPAQTGTEHNALEDARWNKIALEYLDEVEPQQIPKQGAAK